MSALSDAGSRRSFLKTVTGNRRTFLKTAAAGAAIAISGKALPQSPPNIILITGDDLGYGDLGCYGSCIATPNADQMSHEGMRFTHAYAGGPVCSPSRASLMTGRYPARVGIPRVLDPGDPGIPASETTIAQMLKTVGYSTMCVGKWHLGDLPQYLPTNHGFDEFYGLPYSADMTPLPLMHNLAV